jgi:hypothetical protein
MASTGPVPGMDTSNRIWGVMFATLPDALLRRANLRVQLIKKLQVLFHRVPGLWWQFYQTLRKKIPSPYPKKVAYLFEGNCVSGKGSVDVVFSRWYECAPEKSSSAPALVGLEVPPEEPRPRARYG